MTGSTVLLAMFALRLCILSDHFNALCILVCQPSLPSTQPLLSVLWFCIYCAQPFFLLPIQPPWFTAPPSSYVQLLAEGSFTALRVPVFYSFQFNASSVSSIGLFSIAMGGIAGKGVGRDDKDHHY